MQVHATKPKSAICATNRCFRFFGELQVFILFVYFIKSMYFNNNLILALLLFLPF